MLSAQTSLPPETIAKRNELYRRLDTVAATPLWNVMARLVTPQPQPLSAPGKWEYDRMRELLLEAGELITAKEAERRVLILENTGLRGMSQITQSLYAGLQMILPGEIAPSHRHAASALRFVLEGEGGYTAVDGERIFMEVGDFIITPSWTFHDHGNHGKEPVIWLDGLDVPIVNLFATSFAQSYPGEQQAISRPEGDARARYGSGLLPIEHVAGGSSSPVFHYPYKVAKASLDALLRAGTVDAWHGVKLQYVNPLNGDYAMPTMAAYLQLLPRDFASLPYRSTDSMVFCVKDGQGESIVGEQVISWKRGDVFVVPSWSTVTHRTEGEAVLFSFSDRAAQKKLGLWREEKEGTSS
ncbi:gentisate 1,2-dioxygenase [Herbaspirillum lusitanum]|uniref:gentisate 1,2-dioxygenase n=1 Tax=Herbaspirillum lusitanum TaxID=213312 RepID=UPI00031666F4|nr:gentisate 1,2-dioxygenase [Herbaspirillum lusitanum]